MHVFAKSDGDQLKTLVNIIRGGFEYLLNKTMGATAARRLMATKTDKTDKE